MYIYLSYLNVIIIDVVIAGLPGGERAVVGRGLAREERELLAVVGVLRLHSGRVAVVARLVRRYRYT